MKSNVQCEECYKYFYDESDCLHHQCSGIHWWMISDYEDSFEFKYYNLLFKLSRYRDCHLCHDHFEDLIYLIDEQTKFSNFNSILYYNDNIMDCSENLKLTVDFTRQILTRQIEQLQQALNYVNNIENNIDSYMENQKLTEEEINRLIDLTLEYNRY